MVVIDSDVFLLEFAFHRDQRYPINSSFLSAVRGQGAAITVYNLMEILGQLSFNLAPHRLAEWRLWLQEAYNLTVIWPAAEERRGEDFFRDEIYTRPLVRMQEQRMAFVDALIIGLAERVPGMGAFITWNARHFQGKTALPVYTPAEWLSES